ncbi:MAG: insulinase family protein [Myxococcota bacterium]
MNSSAMGLRRAQRNRRAQPRVESSERLPHGCALLLLATLAACAGAPAPIPRGELVPTPTERRLEAPPSVTVAPPEWPRVLERRRDNARMWYVRTSAETVSLQVQSRRGNDGAYPLGLVEFTTQLASIRLRHRLPGARVSSGVSAEGAFVRLEVPADELAEAVAALQHVLHHPADISDVRQLRNVWIANLRRAEAFSEARRTARYEFGGYRARLGQGLPGLSRVYQTFTPELVHGCWQERFDAQDRLLIVAGGFDDAALRAAFDARFSSQTGSTPRRPAETRAPTMPPHAVVSQHAPSPQAYVTFARIAPSLGSPDRRTYEMLVALLGGSFSGQLNTLRSTHGYTYGVSTDIAPMRGYEMLFIEMAFEPERIRPAIQALFEQLRVFLASPISEAKLNTLRNRIWAAERQALGSVQGIAALLGRAFSLRLTPRQMAERSLSIANITPSDLAAVAQRHFTSSKALLLVSGDFGEIAGFTVTRNASGFHLQEDD